MSDQGMCPVKTVLSRPVWSIILALSVLMTAFGIFANVSLRTDGVDVAYSREVFHGTVDTPPDTESLSFVSRTILNWSRTAGDRTNIDLSDDAPTEAWQRATASRDRFVTLYNFATWWLIAIALWGFVSFAMRIFWEKYKTLRPQETERVQNSRRLRRLMITAIFLAIALVIRTLFRFYIPLFGYAGIRIGISGIFSIMPSILFGPVYGALASGLSDMLGHFLSPRGPYLPAMTLIVAGGGFIRGALFWLLRGRKTKVLKIIVITLTLAFLIFGGLNLLFFHQDGIDAGFYDRLAYAGLERTDINTSDMHWVSRLAIERTINTQTAGDILAGFIIVMTWGMLGIAVLGGLILLADLFFTKRLKNKNELPLMPLLIAMVTSGAFVTTLNTFLLRETVFVSWQLLPFAAVWIPRLIDEVLTNIVFAYFVATLYGVFRQQRDLRELVN